MVRNHQSGALRPADVDTFKDFVPELFVNEDVQIEIVMDPALSESQWIIDADSGVYDCSLDVELDNLTRDLRSLCSGPAGDRI